MIEPGRYLVNAPVRLQITITDEDDNPIDPATVRLKTMSPDGIERTYTYGVEANMLTEGPGIYLADITPDQAGRWHVRWEAETPTTVQEDEFIVVRSAFYERHGLRDYW